MMYMDVPGVCGGWGREGGGKGRPEVFLQIIKNLKACDLRISFFKSGTMQRQNMLME